MHRAQKNWAANLCDPDWNVKTGDLIAEARVGTPPAIRTMAIVQTAAFGAVNAITLRYPAGARPGRRRR